MAEHEQGGTNYVIAISIVASALILAGVIWVAANGITSSIADLKGGVAAAPTSTQSSIQTQPTTAAQQQGSADLSFTSNYPSLGPQNAKVTVVEFSDFQCPFCGIYEGREYGGTQFDAARGTMQKIRSDYIQAGKSVRLVYAPVAFLGQESVRAAQASLCALDQGSDKFWAYHDYLFQKQNGENQGAFADANLKQFAAALHLDTAKFNQCFDGNKYQAQVQSITSDANSKAGVTGTPTTFVNGQQFTGAQPYSSLKAVIDTALAS